MTERDAPAERILRLAAYAHRVGRPISLVDIVDDVPGYENPVDGKLLAGTPEWETVRKRVSRDIADLHEHWGIELAYAEADHSYSLRAPYFTAPERAALIAAAATVDVEGVDIPVPGALGSAVGDAATQIVLRVHDLVATLRTAIGTRTAVTFVHDDRTRHVEPYALGTWRTHWYLAGLDVDAGELRRFRLDRIERGDGTDPVVLYGDGGAYEVPHDFDADAAFDLDPNVWGTDPVMRARVRVHRDHVIAFQRELGGETVASDTDGSVIELEVRHYGSFRNRLLAFRTNAVVLAPPDLVAMVRDHLAALVEAR
jgi:predicted DNA-binding transcriptional regulator YafY